MRQRIRTLAGLLLVSIGSGGCATLLSGTTQKVEIVSDPPGATARVAGKEVVTPATVELARNSAYQVTIEKEGYEPAKREIARKMNEQIYWNVFAGGIFVGMLVDVATGACYKLEPSVVKVSLVPTATEPAARR